MKQTIIVIFILLLTSVGIANDNRFQLSTHNYRIKRKTHEVYIKLDRYSGMTWKYNEATSEKWEIIPEGKDYPKLESGNEVRYKLFCHNFYKSNKEDEIYIRFDMKTGKSWKWCGKQLYWIKIEEEK